MTPTAGDSAERASLKGVGAAGGARLLTFPLTAAATLYAAHLTIQSLGLSVFGVVSLLSLIVALIPFADLGLGGAVTSATAHYREAPAEWFATLAAAVRATVFSGLTIAVVALGMLASGVWPWVLGGAARAVAPSAPLAATLVACSYAIGVPLSLGSRVLIGAGRSHTAIWFSVLGSAVSLAIIATASHAHASMPWFAVSPVIGVDVASVAICAVALRTVDIRLVALMSAAWRKTGEPDSQLRTTAGSLLVIAFLAPIAFQLDRIVLSQLSNAKQLAEYALAAQLYAALWSVLYAGGTALWPMFSRAKREGGIGPLLRQVITLFSLAGAAAGLGLAILGPVVSGLLASQAEAPPRRLFVIFGLLLLVQAANLPAVMLLTDGVNARAQARIVALSTMVNILLTVGLSARIGAFGPVLGSVLAVGLIQTPLSLLVCRRLAVGQSALSAAGDKIRDV